MREFAKSQFESSRHLAVRRSISVYEDRRLAHRWHCFSSLLDLRMLESIPSDEGAGLTYESDFVSIYERYKALFFASSLAVL